ncbi:Uncharacterised protein [Halioglobus japonicus]|nr:Uncharacterised protein [Halioglobus japonicus]
MRKPATAITLIIIFMLPIQATALPILSADGSLLTGVLVNEQLYDVTFGDAVIGEAYPLSVIRSFGWFDFANAMKQGIVDALNALPSLPSPADINGCDGSVFIIDVCLLIIPDGYRPGVLYSDNIPRYLDRNAAALRPDGAERFDLSVNGALPANQDTAGDFIAGNLTIAQFGLASTKVPAPSSLALFVSALLLMVRAQSRSSLGPAALCN